MVFFLKRPKQQWNWMSINVFYEDNSIGRTFAVKPDTRQKVYTYTVLTSDAGDGDLLNNKKEK